MWAYVLSFLLLLSTYLYYRWILLPKNKMSHYAKLFRAKGYKVCERKYVPYSAPFYMDLEKDSLKNNDVAYTHKTQYVGKDVLVTNMLTRPSIVVFNEELIKELLGPDKIMTMPKDAKVTELFFAVIGKGMSLSEGNQWKHKRKLLSQVFTHDFITALIPKMVTIIEQTFDNFDAQHLQTNKQGKSVIKGDLFDLMVKFTSSVVAVSFLGLDILEERLRGESMVDIVLRLMSMCSQSIKDPLLLIFGSTLLNKRWRKFDKTFMDLNDQVNSILKGYIHQMDKKDASDQNRKEKTIVQLLLQARKKSDENKQNAITDDELVDQIKTFFFAGSDTTSNVVTAMLLFVYEKPSVLSKLQNQINSFVRSDADINVETFKKMTYLDNVISQAMRMFSTVGGLFQRQFNKDTLLGGVPVQRGTLVDGFWISLLYDPKNFENPHQFIPERWEKQECKKRQHLVAYNFSGGPRGCLGKNLALIEIRIIMIKFIKRYGKLVELGLKDGKRGYFMRGIFAVKNSEVELTKMES